MASWQKLRRLPRAEQWLLAQALAMLPLTVLGVYLLGVGRWQRALIRLAPFLKPQDPETMGPSAESTPGWSGSDDQAVRQKARVIARIMRIATQHGLVRGNCLQQSLVLWWLLGRHHVPSEIRFGARKEAGQLKAHAWVECFGFALNEDPDVCRHYAKFAGVGTTAQPGV